MTTVRIFRSEDRYKGFVSDGHSGFAEAGSDIVCAAISVLTINTINSIESLAGDRVEASESDGHLECHFPEKLSEKGNLLMDAMILGLKSVGENYRESLRIEIEEV